MDGAEFERSYLAGQLEGHRALLQVQESLIKAGAPRESFGIAKMARGQITEHIALLQGLQSALRTP